MVISGTTGIDRQRSTDRILLSRNIWPLGGASAWHIHSKPVRWRYRPSLVNHGPESPDEACASGFCLKRKHASGHDKQQARGNPYREKWKYSTVGQSLSQVSTHGRNRAESTTTSISLRASLLWIHMRGCLLARISSSTMDAGTQIPDVFLLSSHCSVTNDERYRPTAIVCQATCRGLQTPAGIRQAPTPYLYWHYPTSMTRVPCLSSPRHGIHVPGMCPCCSQPCSGSLFKGKPIDLTLKPLLRSLNGTTTAEFPTNSPPLGPLDVAFLVCCSAQNLM